MFKKLLLIIILVLSLANEACSLSVPVPDKIKVALVENSEKINIAVKSPYKITTIETNEVLKQGDIMWQGEFSVKDNSINLKTYKHEDFKIYGINIKPKNSPSVYVNDNLYRGTLQIIKTKQGKLTAVNILDLEDYVKGVLYHEVSHRWPIEAIKAQAVVSRSFAIYQAQQRQGSDFYLDSTTSSQVYRGVFAEKFRTNLATDLTKGKILLYKGRIVPAFFHSACGGRTERVSNLWKLSLKPLKGIRCKFCVNSPVYNWQKQISLSLIQDKLLENNINVGKIKSIKILSKNSSKRVKYIMIKGSKAHKKISGKDFRKIVGPRNLLSRDFNVQIVDDNAIFKGHGWGHGVGMCQWGAFAMAKKRYGYKRILEYYYPGAKVVQLTK